MPERPAIPVCIEIPRLLGDLSTIRRDNLEIFKSPLTDLSSEVEQRYG